MLNIKDGQMEFMQKEITFHMMCEGLDSVLPQGKILTQKPLNTKK